MRIHANYFFLATLVLCFFTAQHAVAQVEIRDVGVSATVVSIPSIDPPDGGGGSGSRSGVRFSGLAYPQAEVSLLLSGGTVRSVVADAMGRFSFSFTDVGTASRLFFAMYAVDTEGRRSTLLNLPVALYTGEVTDISGIRFAPTVTTDKVAIKQGDYLTIEGAALPSMPLEVVIDGVRQKIFTLISGDRGTYRLIAPIALPQGDYLLRTRYERDTRTSAVTRLVVGPTSIPRAETSTNIPGDCNVDQRVTLVDFSVLAFWFNKQNPPPCVDANRDGIVNLTDFSILAFYWNG